MTDDVEILGSDVTLRFWDDRHQANDDMRSGGNIAFDYEKNELLYAVRLVRLIDILGLGSEPLPVRRLLDAGCGKGYYSRAMGRLGHTVDGIDGSPRAVSECQSLAGPHESYAVSTLAEWAPPHQYDAVYCVDVAFHIMVDDDWAASMRNLACLVRLGGLLVVADHAANADRVWQQYQKTRAFSSYDSIFEAEGMSRVGFVPYGVFDSPVGFHVFTRDA